MKPRKSKRKSHGRPGRDLWKPGALSGASHSAQTKRLARRIQRKRDNAAVRKEETK